MADDTRLRDRVLAPVLVLILLLVGCSSGSESEPGGPVAPDDLAAEVSAIQALAPEEQESQLRSLSAEVEGQMLALSGLEAELGGPEQAQAAYSAMTAALVERTTQLRDAPGLMGRFGAAVGLAEPPSLGGMIFAGWMVGALAPEGMVTSTNDAKPGAEPQRDVQKNDDGPTKSSAVREISLESTSVEYTVETTAQGVTGTLRFKITVNPCPDPSGEFTAKASMTASATTGGGRTGSNSTVDIELTGRVDDDARLAGYDYTTTSQAAEFGSGNNIWAEVTDTISFVGGEVTGASRAFGRSAGNVPEGFAAQWADLGRLFAMMLTQKMVAAAQQGWESGRCVALDPQVSAGPKGLQPGASVTVTAAPRSKVDGGKVGGTVTATLAAGEAGVSPASAPADATFTYTAPDQRDKSGTVALEARSRRGVAKASIDFDTRQPAYTASGQDEVTFSGTVASITAPFTVDGTFPGGRATFRFDGASENGGKLRITGGGSGARITNGRGTYKVVQGDDGILFLDVRARSCVDVSGVCRSATHRITLTPQR